MNNTRLLYIGNGQNEMENEINKLKGNDKNQVFILDIYNNYKYFVTLSSGINLTFNNDENGLRINLFDFSMEESEFDGLIRKFDFIVSFLEILINKKLNDEQKYHINKCLKILYEPYIKELKEKNLLIDRSIAPTINDFYNLIINEEQLKEICLALEIFVNGTINIFNGKTNFDTKNPIIRYDLSRIDTSLIPLLAIACMEDYFLRTKQNLNLCKHTYLFIDNLDSIIDSYSTQYISSIWKRIRINGGKIRANCLEVELYFHDINLLSLISNTEKFRIFKISRIYLNYIEKSLGLNKEQINEILNLKKDEYYEI